MGIPTFSVTRKGFAGLVSSAFLSMGFRFDASQYEFPMEMFLPDSDLTPLRENIDKVIDGLTRWAPLTNGKKEKVLHALEKVTVEGEDYVEAIAKLNVAFLKNRWGDGLPLFPATEERVSWFLTGTDLSRNTVVGTIPPSGRKATVESLAVNLAMAGGRPEYMPVLIATIKAFTDPQMRAQLMQTTTCSGNLVVIVNGPLCKQIRLNSGYGCLGPDPAHPAGASIGRAIRLVQQNIGGAIPGSGSMAIYGGPARYANIVFAEDEEGLPRDWEPLNYERGFPNGSNVVTVYVVASTTHVNHTQASNDEVALQTLKRYARIMGADYGNIYAIYNADSVPGIVLVPRGTAQGLSSLGWSKEKVRTFLWENSRVPWSVVKGDAYLYQWVGGTRKPSLPLGDPWPLAASPKNIMIVVAGGVQSGHGYWMRVGCCPVAPASAEIQVPTNWGQLMNEAEEDLGPPR